MLDIIKRVIKEKYIPANQTIMAETDTGGKQGRMSCSIECKDEEILLCSFDEKGNNANLFPYFCPEEGYLSMCDYILFAEDNDNLREVVTDFLSDNGFEVVSVSDGDDAWEKFLDERFDLVLLDVMMPGMSGFDLLRKIRSREDIPVILATAKVQEQDQLLGYSLGADEYVTKPFSLPVLVAKCKAVLERAGGRAMTGKTFADGGFSVDFVTHRVALNGNEIKLASLDFDLLSYFISNRGRVLSRVQILDRIWGFDYDGNDRVVDTHIKRLRKALGEYGSHIETVVKEGYRFV